MTTAVTKKYKLDFHLILQDGKYAKFQLDSIIGGKATECDSQTALDGRQVKKVLLRPSSAGA